MGHDGRDDGVVDQRSTHNDSRCGGGKSHGQNASESNL